MSDTTDTFKALKGTQKFQKKRKITLDKSLHAQTLAGHISPNIKIEINFHV